MTQGIKDPERISIPSGGSEYVQNIFCSVATASLATIIAAKADKRFKIWEFCVQSLSNTANVYFASNSTAITQKVKLAPCGSWIGEPLAIYEQMSPVLVTNVGEALTFKADTTGEISIFLKYTEED